MSPSRSMGVLGVVALALALVVPGGAAGEDRFDGVSIPDPSLVKAITRIEKAIGKGDTKAFLAEVSRSGVSCLDSTTTLEALAADLKGHGGYQASLFDTARLREQVSSTLPVYSMREFLTRDPGAAMTAELAFPPSEEFAWVCWHSEKLGETGTPPCFTLKRVSKGRWVIVSIGADC